MDNGFEKLTRFFEQIKTVSFWQRLFNWNTIRSLSYEAYEEFRALQGSVERMDRELAQSNNERSLLRNNQEHHNQKINEQDKALSLLKQEVGQLTQEAAHLQQENTTFKESENHRREDYESKMTILTEEIQRIRNDRSREQEERHRKEIQRMEDMKQTWATHQENTKKAIKMICQKHTIEYVEKVPFKGTPDNTIKICDEWVIFDAKSPASEDSLQNFPTYIKSQTESVKKYVKEENVRKDVFFVVPFNTVGAIQQFSYNMADYRVYVVTLDVLEPLILSLKKIEDYEYIQQLSPEERENICRILGKFAHITKRRIQIDQFFTLEFLNILTHCKTALPGEILDKAMEFEKSEKLNPPQDKRAKQILIKDLESDSGKIQKEVEAKAIVLPPSLHTSLNSLPLYEKGSSPPPKSP